MVDLRAFALTFTEANSLAAAGENIELSSFGEDEITDVINMQDGLSNLRDLLKGDLSDITGFITNPPGGFVDFKRIAAQFAVGGIILGLTEVSLNYIIHYGDHDNNSNSDNNDNRGHQTTATATATSATSTATPTAWLLNTVRGTSREAFEDFVSKLPDHGKGNRIIYPALNYQNYVGKMTLEEAKAVSKYPIVDQIVSNDPMDEDEPEDSEVNPQLSTRHQHDRRTVPDEHRHDRRVLPGVDITFQKKSPLQLRMISLPKHESIEDLDVDGDDESTEYTFDASAGEGSFVYILDMGFDFDHPVSIIYLICRPCVLRSYPYRNI